MTLIQPNCHVNSNLLGLNIVKLVKLMIRVNNVTILIQFNSILFAIKVSCFAVAIDKMIAK